MSKQRRPAKTETVFDQGDIAAWDTALSTDVPVELGEFEWPSLPQVETFRPQTLTAGLSFNMRCRDGSTFAFVINPVAARHLAACILKKGQDAGWLNAGGDVICPPKPALDS